jgi:hypothetical protein
MSRAKVTGIEGLLQRIAKIEGEIAVLTERVAAKQRERQAIIDEARVTLDGLTRTRPKVVDGVGRGNHDSRRGPQKGTPNYKQRSLTDDQVRELRTKWESGEFSQRELGEQYGLAQPVISSIVHRRTYQDVG